MKEQRHLALQKVQERCPAGPVGLAVVDSAADYLAGPVGLTVVDSAADCPAGAGCCCYYSSTG